MAAILVAKSAGFCFGVKRAINIAERCAGDSCADIYTLGPIIHNPQVVERLEKEHIHAKKGLDEIDGGTVIVRSHGIKLEEYNEAKKKGLNVVDATCPFVKKAQDLVSELAKAGYFVVVAGEKDHPEVRGLISYGADAIRVAESPEDLADLPRMEKVGVVAQTTLPAAKFDAIVAFLLGKAGEVKICNTICNATSIRQDESSELARKVDCMIVVGGRNSANTRRLYEICKAIKPETYHVEVADEIEARWFDGVGTIGVTSGASTPDWIIEEVVAKISCISAK